MAGKCLMEERSMRYRKTRAWLGSTAMTGALLAASAVPFAVPAQAQHGRGNSNYYSGMHGSVQRGGYNQRYGNGGNYHGRDDHGRDDHHSGGGIGPGYGALIGGGGGAALGALFGGGMKGTLIGGAAGAGLGALGGKLAQGNDHDHHDYHHR